MQMPLTHWKMRIRPGIAEIFFLAVRRFSVRQFLSHFVLVSRFACFFFFFSYNCAVGNTHGTKSNVVYMGKAWLFSARISSQWGNLEATGDARLILREGELGLKEVCGTALPAVNLSPAVCITAALSWLRALDFCASLDKDSPEREVKSFLQSIKLPFGDQLPDAW